MTSDNDIIVAWFPAGAATTTLTKETPLNAKNAVVMDVQVHANAPADSGIKNIGYWGIPLTAVVPLHLSIFLMTVSDSSTTTIDVKVAMKSADGLQSYAEAIIANVDNTWQKYSVLLTISVDATGANLFITFEGPAVLRMDVVSCFLAEHVERGKERGLVTPWPFRDDLLEALKALKPRFLRFPGGCYVEGDRLAARFQWKTAVGKIEDRPGHHNSMWGYYSTDGLGLFEYMLLAEELNAQPVWVITTVGIAHQDQVPTKDIKPWIQDALDSIEFITGSADSQWGSVRAAMGRQKPWALNYLTIGNEGCGLPWDTPNVYYKPYFLSNYLAFYGAIKALYPHVQLLASCEMHDLGPTEIFEYHVYSNPNDLFSRRHAFDNLSPDNSPFVLASEYAVTDGGGHGNLIGAVGEATFMTGMERNHKIVLGGSYAPLLVNANSIPWPTNLLWFDSSRWYAIPSYYVQKLFSEHLGVYNLPITLDIDEPVATAASCLDKYCNALAFKLVNFASDVTNVSLSLLGQDQKAVSYKASMYIITSENPEDENSFETTKVAPVLVDVDGAARKFDVALMPFSVNVLLVNLTMPSLHTEF